MEIVMEKDPFNFKRFKTILKYDQSKVSNDDAEVFGLRVASQLQEHTKVKWGIESCVGGKCHIGTKMIRNREKRKKLKGQVFEVNGGILED